MIRPLAVLCALVLAAAASAEPTDPAYLTPSPEQPLLVMEPSFWSSSQFEQGEYARTFLARARGVHALPAGWFTLDSAILMVSPRLKGDLIAGNAGLFSCFYRTLAPGLAAGPFVSHFSTGTLLYSADSSSWQTETDQQQLALRAEYAPSDPFRIGLTAGLQSNGNRSPGRVERNSGFLYDFSGSAEAGPGFLPSLEGYSLALHSSRAFVPENVSSVQSVRLGGAVRLSGRDTLSAAGGAAMASNRAFNLVKTDRLSRFLAIKLHKVFFAPLAADFLFEGRQDRLDYPDDSLSNKQETALSGETRALLALKRVDLGFKADLARSGLEYARTSPLDERPSGPEETAAAERHLMNETMAELALAWNARFRYWRLWPVYFSRTMNIRRYDHPFSYQAPAGGRAASLDTRDIVRDADTLTLLFPAFDSGAVRFSRSSLLENFLDSSRSYLNHLSTTYSFGLGWLFQSEKILFTREEFSVSVNEDSAFYVMNVEIPHRFFRRREIYSFNDLNFVPLFRGLEDSVVIRPLYAVEEDGKMSYEDAGRFFHQSGRTVRRGLTLRLVRRFFPGLTAGCGWRASDNTGYTLDESGGGFKKDFTSKNSEASSFVSYARKRLFMNLEGRQTATRFNDELTSDYFSILFSAEIRL